MASLDILYLILGVSIVVISVTIVWFANEAIRLIRSLRRSTDDVAMVTKEFKDKVLLMSEALDRVGTSASRIIGLVEDAEAEVRTKREKLSDGIGLIVGVADYSKKKKGVVEEKEAIKAPDPKDPSSSETKENKIENKPKDEPKKEEKENPKDPPLLSTDVKKDQPEVKPEGEKKEEEKKEETVKTEENKEIEKPVKEEVGAMPSVDSVDKDKK